jgi:DNA-binding transcriptional regulator LsrR (DeoR family)
MSDKGQFDDLTVRMAWLYYREGLTQQQIARKFRTSRPTVARTLQRARSNGLVEFRFAEEPERRMLLEKHLCERHGLDEAILVRSREGETALRSALAQATAAYLACSLRDGMVVGLGASRTLHDMADVFAPPSAMPNCVFVEMVGGIAAEDPRFDTYNVSWRLAEKCGGIARHLFTPAVVDTSAVKQAVLKDGRVAGALQLAQQCDVGIVAVGVAGSGCPLVQMGNCEAQVVDNLRARGAVGEIIGRFYDIEGKPLVYELDDRLIGLDWEQISALPFVVAVGAGAERVAAILGALRQQFIKVLITDFDTGTALAERQ